MAHSMGWGAWHCTLLFPCLTIVAFLQHISALVLPAPAGGLHSPAKMCF